MRFIITVYEGYDKQICLCVIYKHLLLTSEVSMNVSIYSREAILQIIAERKFPENTAVISFYDSEIKHIDKDYTHVDYSGVCDTVFYSEVDDLDIDYLAEQGYTYDTYFPEADKMAVFIVKSFINGKNIICQCEYGQSRSAGCAAAILEYFYGNGVSVFSDYSYYPNQVVFHKIYDAFVRINPKYSFGLYTYEKLDRIHQYRGEFIDFTTGATTLFSRNIIERKLTDLGICCHSFEEAINLLQHGKAKVYVSLHIDNAMVCNGQMGEHNIGVKQFFNYKNKDIPLTIIFPKFLLYQYTRNKNHDYYSKAKQCSVGFLRHKSISLDVLGIMELDCGDPIIEKALITNIEEVSKSDF